MQQIALQLLECVALAEAANLIAWAAHPIQLIKRKLNLGFFFDCPRCLAFWLGVLCFSPIFWQIFVTSIVSALIERFTRL